jgi:hypothetical protein
VHKSFFGMTSRTLYIAGMKTKSELPDVYLDFIRQNGIPSALRRYNAKSEMIQRACQIHRDKVIVDQWTEPHSPWQNSAELNGVKYLKSHAQVLLNRTGAPDSMWFVAQDYLPHIHNLSANRQINWKIPEQVSRGETPDISHILMFYWFEPVLYLDPVSKFPETTVKPGHFVGFADNIGDKRTFKILKNDLCTVLNRSVVRSAADGNHRNKQVSFKPDVQVMISKLHVMPSNLLGNSHSRQKTRKLNNDVAHRTRSKTGHLEQNVGDRTRSKLQAICNSSVQEVFFLLYDVVLFENHANNKNIHLHLVIPKCQIYHSALTGSKSQIELGRLHQLHVLGRLEDDEVKSWECTKVLKYCEEIGMNTITNHKCQVEWNDINKSQSWVNFFAISLSDPTTIISFARNQKLLNIMPFVVLYGIVKPKHQWKLLGYIRLQQVQLVSNINLEFKFLNESRMLSI